MNVSFPNYNGNKLHSLIDKVYSIRNLRKAYRRCARRRSSCGADGISWYQYRQNLNANLANLSDRIRTESYHPAPYKIVTRGDANGKIRHFYIPSVEDRVVQRTIRQVIEPFYEQIFYDGSLEYRPNRSPRLAPEFINHFFESNLLWIIDADVYSFYMEVKRSLLDSYLSKYIADGRFLRLIQRSFEKCDDGLPVGHGLSPFLSNIYLNETDHQLVKNGIHHLRLCDRFLLFECSSVNAKKSLAFLQKVLGSQCLMLNESKTRLWYRPDPNKLIISEIGPNS